MNPVFQELGICPCESIRCGVIGTKLTKFGHLVGCKCSGCIGRRNKQKGRRSEAKVYRALGGDGPTLKDDLMFTMSLDVAYENKTGKQVPQSIRDFLDSKFFKDALRQAEKKKPVGVDCRLAVTLDLGADGMFAIVDIRPRRMRKT